MVRWKVKKEWMMVIAGLIGLVTGSSFAAPTYAFAVSVGWPVLEATLLAFTIPGIVSGGLAWALIKRYMRFS